MDKAQTKADKNQTAEEKIHHSKNTNQHGGKRIQAWILTENWKPIILNGI